jgi:hypothetical protein
VRKIRAKQKKFKERAHYRKMEKRSRIVKEVLSIKESAEAIRAKEQAYQEAVFRKWQNQMLFDQRESDVSKKLHEK